MIEPGTIRDDGYVFVKYHKHQNGKTYPMYLSPIALERQRERVRNWRLNNLDYSRQLVRDWRKRKKEAKEAKKTDPKDHVAMGAPKLNKNSKRVAIRSKSRHFNKLSGTPKVNIPEADLPSAKKLSSAKMAQAGNGIGVGLVPLVPFQGIPLRGIYPIKLAPLGTTTNPHSVPFTELAPKQSNIKNKEKLKNNKNTNKNNV